MFVVTPPHIYIVPKLASLSLSVSLCASRCNTFVYAASSYWPTVELGSIIILFAALETRLSSQASYSAPDPQLLPAYFDPKMPRRLGSTVPQTVSRLLQGGLLPQPPAWFGAVTSIAPVRPSLTKRVPKQDPEPSTSTPSSSSDPYAWKGSRKVKSARSKAQLKYRPAKPAEIKGLELQDELRQNFYKDHPFEAFKGINLVEQDSILVDSTKPGPVGKHWAELRQRSSNPSPEESVLV